MGLDGGGARAGRRLHGERTPGAGVTRWGGGGGAGEDVVRDAVLEEPPVTPNVLGGVPCDDDACPLCSEVLREESEPDSATGPDPV